MQCNDTGSHEAIRLEHLDKSTVEQINNLIGVFKESFHGNGRLTLTISGGHVSEFETNTKTRNYSKKSA